MTPAVDPAAERTDSNLLITLTGPDAPGVTSSLFAVLRTFEVTILDVEQDTFRSRLQLSTFVGVDTERRDALAGAITRQFSGTLMHVDIVDAEAPVGEHRPASTHAVVILGSPLTADALTRIGETIAHNGANIDTIRGIADYPLTGVEMLITSASREYGQGVLRADLAELSAELGVDIALSQAGLSRRAKRLICFDVDSTLVQGEVIEMLAAYAGKEAEVAAVTEAAMRGELDFAESLHARVATLEGLDASILDEVAANIQLTPGARTTIRTLQRLGYKTGVVSGGFVQVIEHLAKDLQLDYYRANTLEIVDGKLTGKVIGAVIDRAAKAETLKEYATNAGVRIEQTIAVGDGANDIDMLTTAGLGIAYCAKPALKEVADASLSYPFLDAVLFLLGITRDEIDAADEDGGTIHRVPVGPVAARA